MGHWVSGDGESWWVSDPEDAIIEAQNRAAAAARQERAAAEEARAQEAARAVSAAAIATSGGQSLNSTILNSIPKSISSDLYNVNDYIRSSGGGEEGGTATTQIIPIIRDVGGNLQGTYNPLTGKLENIYYKDQSQGGYWNAGGAFVPYQSSGGFNLGNFVSGMLSGTADLLTSDMVKTLAPAILSGGLGGATGVGNLLGTNPIIGGAVLGGGTSALTGGDIGQGILTGAAGGAIQSSAQGTPSEITVPTSAEALPSSFDEFLAAPSTDILKDTITNTVDDIASTNWNELYAAPTTNPITGETIVGADVSQYPNQNFGTSAQDAAPFETPAAQPTDIFKDTTVDTSPVDYSLTGTGAPRLDTMNGVQGLQVSAISEPVTVATTPIDYSLNVPSVPFEGLQMPTIPNLDSMGGGQGLSVAVPGGTVAAGGFVPTGTLPALGDPTSFINDTTAIDKAIATPPTPTGLSKEQFLSLLKGLTGLFGTAAVANGASPSNTQTVTPFVAPTQRPPTYSPEYFQQIQQGYNQLLPTQPKDVATPLQNWYNSSYSGAPDSVTAKLFGVI